MRKLLADKVEAGEIKSFVVTRVPDKSHAEIFLLALLYGVAQKKRWGTEADIVTALDWPAKAGALPPQGRVTVRIDPRGSATAELIATGPVPAVPQTTLAAGTAKLTGPDFGLASVTGWSGQNPTKDSAEISDVLAALELLKSRAPQNISALTGVALIRVRSLAQDRAGEFFAGSEVATGAAADVKPWLKLADRAFGSNDVQFFGGGGGPSEPTVPASFFTILHEVGHAVETEQLRLARARYAKTHADVAAAAKVIAEGVATFDADLKKAERKGKRAVDAFYKERAASYKKNIEAQEDAAKQHLVSSDTLKGAREPTGQHTKRLQKFIDLVEANKIRKFTQYSAQNWAKNKDEFYAEAYALWLVDPTFMRTNYKVVYDFFQGGDYLK